MQVLETSSATPASLSEPWVDIHSVVKHIGFCDRTIKKMVKEGKLPGRAVRNGARTYLRFQLSAVDAAIKAGATE